MTGASRVDALDTDDCDDTEEMDEAAVSIGVAALESVVESDGSGWADMEDDDEAAESGCGDPDCEHALISAT